MTGTTLPAGGYQQAVYPVQRHQASVRQPGNGPAAVLPRPAKRPVQDHAGVDVRLRQEANPALLPLFHACGPLQPLTTVMGVNGSGRPVLHDFGKNQSWHMLVDSCGGPGGAEMLRASSAVLALGNRQSRLQYVALDPGGRELAFLESCPHMLTEVVRDWVFTEEILQWLVREALHRQRYHITNPQIIVWINDLHTAVISLSRAARQRLVSLWQRGPEFGIHIAASGDRAVLDFSGLFPSLASSVQYYLADRQRECSADGERKVRPGYCLAGMTEFKPVSFSAREMNLAADLMHSDFRLTGTPGLASGGIHVSSR